MTNSLPSARLPVGPGRLFTLRNERDMAVTIAERGAALVSWWAPDRYGRMADVLLGLAHIDQGKACAPGPRHLSGAQRLDAAPWKGMMGDQRVSLHTTLLASADGGAADVELSYLLDDHGRLRIDCQVVAQEGGTIDFGTHPCFNLNGGHTDVGDHMLQIDAGHYLKIDHGGIPLGVAAVGGTPCDFRTPAPIGARLTWPDVQLDLAGGFDHCYWIGRCARYKPGTLRQVGKWSTRCPAGA